MSNLFLKASHLRCKLFYTENVDKFFKIRCLCFLSEHSNDLRYGCIVELSYIKLHKNEHFIVN